MFVKLIPCRLGHARDIVKPVSIFQQSCLRVPVRLQPICYISRTIFTGTAYFPVKALRCVLVLEEVPCLPKNVTLLTDSLFELILTSLIVSNIFWRHLGMKQKLVSTQTKRLPKEIRAQSKGVGYKGTIATPEPKITTY